ncbi:hypothetical protein QBC35DRAFT_141736 [Podospora australis]|uniref:Uncharacterized protein n=1 Tax=Podospora australis TaxID=1536484 RepID=A0AAN7AKK1_9PEZI|nr:hypothetical protein QBC35DRAFT_141736 [Podospora australis]
MPSTGHMTRTHRLLPYLGMYVAAWILIHDSRQNTQHRRPGPLQVSTQMVMMNSLHACCEVHSVNQGRDRTPRRSVAAVLGLCITPGPPFDQDASYPPPTPFKEPLAPEPPPPPSGASSSNSSHATGLGMAIWKSVPWECMTSSNERTLPATALNRDQSRYQLYCPKPSNLAPGTNALELHVAGVWAVLECQPSILEPWGWRPDRFPCDTAFIRCRSWNPLCCWLGGWREDA